VYAEQAATVAHRIAIRRAAAPGTEDKKRDLTPAELQLVRDLFASRGGKITDRFGMELVAKDIECLQPRQWLNDEVMNFYFELMCERSRLAAKDESCPVRVWW